MVTVIVPVYKVESYLPRCIDSLLNQSYSDLEIILVDDGSPDNCPYLCDMYSNKDTRVKVIHKVNAGLSSARNAGLNIASGDYICFVDSDDWISINCIEFALSLMQRFSADIVEYGIFCTSKYITSVSKKETVTVFRGKDILQDYLLSTTKGAGFSVCKCLFSKQVIGNIRFREGFNNEDIDFKYKVLSNSEVLVKSNRILYFYFQGVGSITTSGFLQKDFDLDIASDILVELTQNEEYGSIAYLARVKKARCAFAHLCKIALMGCHDDRIDLNQLIPQLVSEHRQNLPILLRSPIPFSRKMLALSFAVSYGASKLMIRLFRKIIMY